MCGILAALGLQGDAGANRRKAIKQSLLLRHRGPDKSGVYQSSDGKVVLCHERLSIVDPSDAGHQPMRIIRPQGDIVWICNSEIYNHDVLRKTELADYNLSWSSCDSAVMGYLYQKYGTSPTLPSCLDGIFACVIYDENTGEYVAFRDPIGICSLYWGKASDGTRWFANELKALHDVCVTFDIFPPGHFYDSKTDKLTRFFNPTWISESVIPSNKVDYDVLKRLLIKAVVKRTMTDVPFAMYLSGGLDSSLVAAIATKHLKDSRNTFDNKARLHTFSIGIKGSPDLRAARKVASYLQTVHHECYMTVQEGIDALPDLIYHQETYHQFRAGLPNYLLARRVKAAGFKVVLSGEGADEVFCGYLYFHKAPSPEELQQESVRLVNRLHYFDVLRAHKASYSFGIEARVPFLDLDLLQYAMTLDPREKVCNMNERPDGIHPKMEKYILRKAFDDPENPYLPESVLFRQKEAFSDGVGYDWVDGLKDYSESRVTDEEFAQRESRFSDDVPGNKELYFIQRLFEETYPKAEARKTVYKGPSVACCTPFAMHWDPEWSKLNDISGRVIDVHASFDKET